MILRCSAKRLLILLVSLLLIVNLVVIHRLLSSASDACPNLSQSVYEQRYAASSNEAGHPSVVFVMRDFEEFSNDVVATASNLSSAGYRVVVVVDRYPYPPLSLPVSPFIQLVPLEGSITEPLLKSRPELHITSAKYVAIIPAGIRVSGSDGVHRMVHFLEKSSRINPSVAIAAFSVERANAKSRLKCLDVNFSLKQWTLDYSIATNNSVCDALDGTNVVLLLKTETLMNFSFPFLRPTTTALFVQSTLRQYKIAVDRQKTVQFYSTPLFDGNAHHLWKYKQLESERIRLAYAQLGVKLVRKVGGKEEWYGCGKDTGRCFGTVVNEMPEYIFRNRWTPPCCLRALRETALYVFQVLDSEQVRYWLEGGSLLGAARNGDIIPWDYDIDIGIYREDVGLSQYLSRCRENGQAIIDENGFVWEKATEGDFYRVQYSQTNHLHVDIFPFYSRNGTMTKDTWFKTHRQDTEFPERFLQPRTKISFVGTEAFAPNNIRTFLELKFGAGVIENPRFPNSETVVNVKYDGS